jgi:hypothetical protein
MSAAVGWKWRSARAKLFRHTPAQPQPHPRAYLGTSASGDLLPVLALDLVRHRVPIPRHRRFQLYGLISSATELFDFIGVCAADGGAARRSLCWWRAMRFGRPEWQGCWPQRACHTSIGTGSSVTGHGGTKSSTTRSGRGPQCRRQRYS